MHVLYVSVHVCVVHEMCVFVYMCSMCGHVCGMCVLCVSAHVACMHVCIHVCEGACV